jgi:hypothetical protein
MEGKLSQKERLVYNKIDLESYKYFFNKSQDIPLDTSSPIEMVQEYSDFITNLIDSIKIPKEFDFAIRNKENILSNLNSLDNLTHEKANSVISNFRGLIEAVCDVIEKRS